MPDSKLADTPQGRLGIRAIEVLKLVHKSINEGRPPELKMPEYIAASASDFAAHAKLDVDRELLVAQIEIVEGYSASHAFVLKHRLSLLEWEIAQRDGRTGLEDFT